MNDAGVDRDRASATIARFEGELRRFVARRVPGPDADDVLQDSLLRIHRGVGSLRSADQLAPRVYRVARSAIVDHFRRARPSAGTDDEAAPDDLPEEPSAEVRELLAACVAPFLEQIPPDQAAALRLTDLGAMTQAEAAARLGVPLATLKARVQRGRRRLRREFEECCDLVQDARGAVIGATPRCGC